MLKNTRGELLTEVLSAIAPCVVSYCHEDWMLNRQPLVRGCCREESRRHKKARAAEELFTAKVGKPRKATAKR